MEAVHPSGGELEYLPVAGSVAAALMVRLMLPSQKSSRRLVACAIAAILVLGAAFALTTGAVAAGSRTARGQFESDVVVEGCTSPVGICTHGTLRGGVNAEFDFTATSLVPTADTAATSVLLYTGDIVLSNQFGTLTCKDAGAFQSAGSGAVSSVCTIVEGTGQYSGATGTIQFVGNFTLPEGGEGEYRAVINLQ